ncbi:MAG: hypothetical protein JNN11_02390 [Candidatus Doudnabacteria bacterium]|nr:hypothetical protein [Candidatus Doudnabacteria bacterium]
MQINTKIRFKKRDFRQKLGFARNHKRQIKSASTGSAGKGNIITGLHIKTGLLLIFLVGIMYLVFIPNFLFIKNIEVLGLRSGDRDEVKRQIFAYLNTRKFFPEKNILLLNTAKLSDSLTRQNINILALDSIKKDYPNSLRVVLLPRMAKFMVIDQNTAYQVSEDGILLNKDPANQVMKPFAKELVLKIQPDWVVGQEIISREELLFLTTASEEFSSLGINVSKLIAPEGGESTFSVKTDTGLEIKFENNSGWQKSLSNLKSLIKQVPDLKSMAYIDLRVTERAYVCPKNASCSTQPQNPINTSTPDSLLKK